MRKELSGDDRKLIEYAREAINRNFDGLYHVVGAALRCRSGNIYTGVNCDGIHGSCAEFIAVGAAISNGERDFDCIVAVGSRERNNIVVSPCGNCRQMLFEYSDNIDVIIQDKDDIFKIGIDELLPYAYKETWMEDK